ncbi:MAG TPA: carboxylating nicotinate-nucleotide diphosphorylase [Acidimicrobiales bacterium]|nr:carboxylating nicotinate-nucleotide diphosphorylase [Acidimicrobiales bacterium]
MSHAPVWVPDPGRLERAVSGFDPPPAAVREVVACALAEDLLPLGDLTAGLLDPAAVGSGAMVARSAGVLAGSACAVETFAQLDPAVTVRFLLGDGSLLEAGTKVAEMCGPLPSVLSGERTALNLLCHLSGVATLTRRFVEAVGGASTRVLDTRKTLPGLRALQKAAVRAGGGHNHRGSLSDMVLVKDNHRAALGVAEAVATARLRWPFRPVEVECDTLDQVGEAVAAGATAVLLDNMSPEEVRRCVELVGGRALTEASGGVTVDTVAAYAATGVDFVSVGALTMSAPSLDLALDLDGGAALGVDPGRAG